MSDNSQDIVRAYHARSKHRFDGYAEGPGQLDWDAQPAPFRHYPGAPRLALPLAASRFERPYAQLAEPPATAAPLNPDSLGALLELSFGISAWKHWGPSRWALRCNPSSGNLHPVESYVIGEGIDDIPGGLHHYDPEDHALEGRALFAGTPANGRWLLLGLSSVMWREAWKYGERAFRYCQLDVGHAIGSLGYAAALLGWRLNSFAITTDQAGQALGLDRPEDFPNSRYAFTEREEPEILLAVEGPGFSSPPARETLLERLSMATWQGRPSPIDSRPGYRWPLIDRVAVASRQNAPREEPAAFAPLPPLAPHPALPGSAALIRQRRSAQRFDPKQQLAKAAFYRILDALLPRPQAPWNSPSGACRIHLLLFVMRVAGLPSGLYLLPRTPTAGGELSSALRLAATGDSELLPVADIDPDCPPHLGLLRLRCMELQELQRHARALSCHQDIASTSAFSLGMLGEFERATAEAQGYRTLLREAGRVGQALYLEAEAAGVRGTGIGCFFDDPVHQLVGLAGTRYQSIYHFTVGTPVSDPRIASEPAYPRHQEKPS